MTYSAARDMIEMEKLLHRPDYYRDMIDLSLDTLKEKYDRATGTRDIIFYGYLYQEKKCFGLDYNDLIKFSLYIFQQNEDIRLKWQRRLEYIMIDEFQDIDQIQYQLMEVLCGLPQEPVRGGRPGPDHLHLAWGQCEVPAGIRQAVPRRQDHPHDGQLPLHPGDPGGGQLPHCQEPGAD